MFLKRRTLRRVLIEIRAVRTVFEEYPNNALPSKDKLLVEERRRDSLRRPPAIFCHASSDARRHL